MVDATFPRTRARHEQANRRTLASLFAAMSSDVRARWNDGASTLLSARWDGRLAGTLFERNMATAAEIGRMTADAVDAAREARQFDTGPLEAYFTENARIVAENINGTTRDELDGADEDEDVDLILEQLETSRRDRLAATMVATAANMAAHDGARTSGASMKMWRVNSGNPRAEHASLDGVTVGIEETFPNGMRWPGDPSGGAEQVANCMCSMEFL